MQQQKQRPHYSLSKSEKEGIQSFNKAANWSEAQWSQMGDSNQKKAHILNKRSISDSSAPERKVQEKLDHPEKKH